MEREGDWDYSLYIRSPGRIKVAGNQSNGLSMSGREYTESQLISLSEETMRPQLMCCALSNPSSSQFRTEVGVSRGNRPKGQDLRGTYSLERISAKGNRPENRGDSISGRIGVQDWYEIRIGYHDC